MEYWGMTLSWLIGLKQVKSARKPQRRIADLHVVVIWL